MLCNGSIISEQESEKGGVNEQCEASSNRRKMMFTFTGSSNIYPLTQFLCVIWVVEQRRREAEEEVKKSDITMILNN